MVSLEQNTLISTTRTLTIPLAISLAVGPAAQCCGDETWEHAKAYTAKLKKVADDAANVVVAAGVVVVAAKADLAAAEAAIAKTRAAGFPVNRAALQKAVNAQAALQRAQVALARATTAAARVTVVVGGVAAGTYISQKARAFSHWAWDPVIPVIPHDPSQVPIYFQATTGEVDSLIPQMVRSSTTPPIFVSEGDFTNAGADGQAVRNFLAESIELSLGLSRGAAAANEDRDAEVLEAVGDLNGLLQAYRESVVDVSEVLRTSALDDPRPHMAVERATFDAAVSDALALCIPAEDDCDLFQTLLDEASIAYDAAQASLLAADFPGNFIGSDAVFDNLTLVEFQQFISDCGTIGEACLPPAEITIADTLIGAAHVSISGHASFGQLIAEYDGHVGDNTNEFAMFDQDGNLNFADLLLTSGTDLSTSGRWLNIDLRTSPLIPEPNALALIGAGFICLLNLCRQSIQACRP